ncbi:MAG: T9SS type A sorting domain-containing protein, partial [Chitinophagales bacterium]
SQFDQTDPRTEGYTIMPRFTSDIDIVSAVNNIELENLSIYPNPATDIVNVSFEAEKIEAVTISVFNTLGALVSTTVKDLNTGMNNVEINVANLTTGIYFVEIQIEAGKTTQRIAVK